MRCGRATVRMQQSAWMHCVIHLTRQGLYGFFSVFERFSLSQKQGSSALSRTSSRLSFPSCWRSSEEQGRVSGLRQRVPALPTAPGGGTPSATFPMPLGLPCRHLPALSSLWAQISTNSHFSHSLSESPLLLDKNQLLLLSLLLTSQSSCITPRFTVLLKLKSCTDFMRGVALIIPCQRCRY